MTRREFNVELSVEQAEKVTREFLIDLLDDVNDPFGDDPSMSDCVYRLIAYMSTPGTWKGGKYDD